MEGIYAVAVSARSPAPAVRALADLLTDLRRGVCRFTTYLAYASVFPPSWHNPWRSIDQHVLHLMLKGRAWLLVDGPRGERRRGLDPGDFCWMAPWTRFETRLVDPADPPIMYHFRFRLDDAAGGLHDFAHPWFILPQAWELRPPCEQWVQAYRRCGPDLEVQQQACLMLIAAALRQRLMEEDAGGPRLDADQRAAIARYLERHGHEAVTSADLARVVGLGRAWFTRLFTATYGSAPRSWLLRERLQRAAAALLEGSAPVAQVAADHGYRQTALFSRQFKREFGCSPRTWRQHHYSPYGR
ncbi:MAG: helix-turn-helix domain-containing protein [Planctomycetota bacterium]